MNDLVKKGALGTILCSSGIITNDDIRRALDEQEASGCRFGEALVRLGIVQQEDIDWALSNQLDIPYVRLSEKIIDRSATQLIPAELARKYNLIPIIRTGDEIHIALADPLNMAAVAQVEEVTGCTVTVSIPIIRELREMLDLFYGPEPDDVTFGFSSNCFSAGILEKINADRSGAHLLEYLLLFYLQNGITSISLQPGGGIVHVSGRRGNTFREIGRFPVSSYPELVTCIRKITRINGSRDLASRGEFLFRYRDTDITLRVSLVRAVEGELITISIRPDLSFPSGLEEMGLGPDTAESFRSLGAPGAGLILFVSWNRGDRDRLIELFLQEIDTSGKNVVILGNGIGKGTLTYPRIPLQPEVPEELDTALAALRDHAPNLLVINDASASHAFLTAWKAAMQGTLVAAGLSRDGLGGAFDQLLQQLQVNRALPAGIRGIVAFTCVKTLCGSCRKNSGGESPGQGQPGSGTNFHAPGCPACRYSGFGGKKFLLDVLPFDLALREILSTARESADFFSHLKKKGFRGIPEKLEDMLRSGEISFEEYQAALPQ